ncbi:MAG: hypothetical protein D6766_14055 [Verrucomicrobia bacterium]|nr:MAG: hypothetical protein D6766_14055 [Verrucomicrobiota bacterium]
MVGGRLETAEELAGLASSRRESLLVTAGDGSSAGMAPAWAAVGGSVNRLPAIAGFRGKTAISGGIGHGCQGGVVAERWVAAGRAREVSICAGPVRAG